MTHQKILNLLNESNNSEFANENGNMSMVNRTLNIVDPAKSYVAHKYENLIFVITMMLTF